MEERVRIRVYVNGEATPSIDMASDIGAGYGFGGSPAPVGSRVMGRYGGQFYNYHIPYQTNIRVTLLPMTQVFHAATGTQVWCTIRGTDNLPLIVGGLVLPKNTRLYLYRNEPLTARPLQEFNLCDVKGAGMLYLVVMTVQGLSHTGIQATDLSYMEGCVRAYVDGETEPQYVSSGLEDYFLGSGYFNQNQTYYGTVGGLTYLDKANAAFSAYRFHDTDPLFFSRGLRLTLRDGDMAAGGYIVGNPQAAEYRTYTWIYQWNPPASAETNAAAPPPTATACYNFLAGVPAGTAGDPVYDGTGVIGSNTYKMAVWNTVNYSGSGDQNITTNAQDSAGNFTSVMIQYGAQGQSNNASPKPLPAASDSALLQNYAMSKNGQQDNIDLSGLPPNAPYKLVLYGTNGPFSNGIFKTKFALLSGEAGQPDSVVLQEATTTETTDAGFRSPENYVVFSGRTNEKGQIFASFSGVGAGPATNEGDFNGLQIEIVKPQP